MPERIVIVGGSFNPPAEHHRYLVSLLSAGHIYDKIIVVPCGIRPDKLSTNDTSPQDRAAMADMTFWGIPKVEVDLFDLESGVFTRTFDLEERYKHLGEIWHFVGGDLILGGSKGQSVIQTEWYRGRELWDKSRFVVAERDLCRYSIKDLPPHCHEIFGPVPGSSSVIRRRILKHQSITGMVTPEVEEYIHRRQIYLGRLPGVSTVLDLKKPRILIVHDSDNPKAVAIARSLSKLEDSQNPNLIVAIGGDGTMLHAVKKLWRRRIPFFGINTGHRGFLLNNLGEEEIAPALKGELIAWQSPLLHVELKTPNGSSISDLAFNDAWVERASRNTAWLTVKINGETKIRKLVGDGILVSTPAGSTAYAKAMGAPPIPVGTSALVLVGSNVKEPVGWKSAYIPSDAEIEIENADSSQTGKRPILGITDSNDRGEVVSMKIRVSRVAFAELVFLKDRGFAQKLMEDQFPAEKEE